MQRRGGCSAHDGQMQGESEQKQSSCICSGLSKDKNKPTHQHTGLAPCLLVLQAVLAAPCQRAAAVGWLPAAVVECATAGPGASPQLRCHLCRQGRQADGQGMEAISSQHHHHSTSELTIKNPTSCARRAGSKVRYCSPSWATPVQQAKQAAAGACPAVLLRRARGVPASREPAAALPQLLLLLLSRVRGGGARALCKCAAGAAKAAAYTEGRVSASGARLCRCWCPANGSAAGRLPAWLCCGVAAAKPTPTCCGGICLHCSMAADGKLPAPSVGVSAPGGAAAHGAARLAAATKGCCRSAAAVGACSCCSWAGASASGLPLFADVGEVPPGRVGAPACTAGCRSPGTPLGPDVECGRASRA